jgi:hypothetical protein
MRPAPDEEEYARGEGLRVEGHHGGDRRMEGGSLIREEPVMWQRSEHVQAGDQRPPEGSGGNRVNRQTAPPPPPNEPHLGEGAGRRLNFERGNHQNPEQDIFRLILHLRKGMSMP